MRTSSVVIAGSLFVLLGTSAAAQDSAQLARAAAIAKAMADSIAAAPMKEMVARLDLEKYRATVKGVDAVWRPAPRHGSQSRGY